MEKGNRVIEAAIIALGLAVLGYCLKAGTRKHRNMATQLFTTGQRPAYPLLKREQDTRYHRAFH